MDKKAVRSFIRKQKKAMTQEEISSKSKKIVKSLLKNSCFLEAEAIYCYVSYNQEVETKELIQEALKMGKKVAVPKVVGENMEFFYITSMDELQVGYQGILEPITEKRAIESKVCLIMPGLAFDTLKNRVGYGGGFYDRYLAKNMKTVFHKIALAFDFQVVPSIDVDSFDQKVDLIITPDGII